MTADVLVVGAGPTGLLLAGELARRGVAVRVVSDRSGPSPLSKAYGIHPRTLEIFDAIGLVDQALAAGTRTFGAQLHVDGARVLRVPLQPKGTQYPFLLSLPQCQTERLLLERVQALGVEVEWNTPCDDQLRIANEPVGARYIVGCDGAHSTVRRAAGIAFNGKSYASDWLLADVVLETDLCDTDTHGFINANGYIALNPRAGDRAYRLIADVTGTPLAGRTGLTRVELNTLLQQRSVPGRLIAEPAASGPFRTQCRRASTLRRGPILLAGDAAHVHSPIGGQGLNAGLQDAWNLAWKLADVVRGRLPDSALDSYEQERLPVIETILANTDRARWMLTRRDPRLRLAIATAMRGVARLQGTVQRFGAKTNGLGIPLPESALVHATGRRATRLAAGSFAGPHVHPDWQAVRAGRDSWVTLPDGHAWIRPDGVVGLRAHA